MPRNKEGTLVLAGFFGRGNAGDEAMLQCVFEEFSPRFNITISLDFHGAYPGFEGWYPYNQARVIHQNDIGCFDGIEDGVGLLIGGGGLPIGFAGGQVFGARAKEMPTAIAGVDVWQSNPDPKTQHARALRTWLRMFDYVIPRTAASLRNVQEMGIPGILGADWALALRADLADEVRDDPHRALVVVREEELRLLPENYQPEIARLLDGLRAEGYNPVLLPFSHEDERFLGEAGLLELAPVERAWWNACRLKQLIGASALTASVGRLHPIIFGAGTGRPAVAMVPPRGPQAADGLNKIREMSEELGCPFFSGVSAFLDGLRSGAVVAAKPELVEAARQRLNFSTHILHGLFRPR